MNCKSSGYHAVGGQLTISRMASLAPLQDRRGLPWGAWLVRLWRAPGLGLALILAVAAVARARHLAGASFPANDGGLFLTMAEDIQRANFLVPQYTSYNGGEIPFAYPPLAIYVTAVLDAVPGVSLITLFVVLPMLGALCSVAAFGWLARTILDSRMQAHLATLAFAVVPASYTWLLPGGGLPRSFGLAAGLVAIRAVVLLVKQDRPAPGQIVFAGAAMAATVLIHLESAAFVGVSVVAFALLAVKPAQIRALGISCSLALVLSAPWWIWVMAVHGLAPFLSSLDQGGALLDDGRISRSVIEYALRNPFSTGEAGPPVVLALAFAGAVVSLFSSRAVLLAWALLLGLVAMRATPTFAAVPTALLAGLGAATVLDRVALTLRTQRPPIGPGAAAASALGVLGLFAFVASSAAHKSPVVAGALHQVPESDRRAMEWAATNTPPDAVFLVLPTGGWWTDATQEWFPAVSQRTSPATAQGKEWLPGEFERALKLRKQLTRCPEATLPACVGELADLHRASFVFVPGQWEHNARVALAGSADYRVAFRDGDTLILQPAATVPEVDGSIYAGATD